MKASVYAYMFIYRCTGTHRCFSESDMDTTARVAMDKKVELPLPNFSSQVRKALLNFESEKVWKQVSVQCACIVWFHFHCMHMNMRDICKHYTFLVHSMQMLNEMVSFYSSRYMFKMCKAVYHEIGRKMLAEYPSIARESGSSKNLWAALTRELSAKIRSARYTPA